jgi:hypothetical protein
MDMQLGLEHTEGIGALILTWTWSYRKITKFRLLLTVVSEVLD